MDTITVRNKQGDEREIHNNPAMIARYNAAGFTAVDSPDELDETGDEKTTKKPSTRNRRNTSEPDENPDGETAGE